MRKLSLIFVVFAAIAVLIYSGLSVERAPDPEPEAAVESTSASPQPSRPVESRAEEPSAPTPVFASKPVASGGTATGGGSSPEKQGLVEFEVINGLAIAYGDVLLGKPRDGDVVGNKGFYEMPTPRLWETPEIPYAINPDLPNPQRVKDAIGFFAITPVRFVPWDGHRDGIVFEPGDEHCYSYLGKLGGLQPIKLAQGCGSAEIIHEIMHALGFIHEQSRTDRDQYIEILWQNIEEKYRPQFAIVPDSLMVALGDAPFDFQSTMLYRADTFAASPEHPAMSSRPGRPAISPIQGGLSSGDLQRLKNLFRAN